MKTFPLAADWQQSLLMVLLFLAMIVSLLLLITVYGGHRDKRKRYLNVAVFLALFALLVVLSDAYEQVFRGHGDNIRLPLPMPLLWAAAAGACLFLAWEIAVLRRTKGQELTRSPVKEAMDRLPSGICYFTMSGTVKLCNLQMYRLFRTLAQKDLQQLSELREALDGCGPDTGVVCLSRDLQNYLFPDGRVWRFREFLVTDGDGISYTEAVFSDLTEQYERERELKKQTRELKEISRQLKRLSDNALLLTREKEVLAAKTKLHDQMGAGLTALRQTLLRPGTAGEDNAVKLLRQAVSAVKNDNEYPPEKDELAQFIQDAGTVGVKVNLTGRLPEDRELSFVCLIAMRECLVNGVRHAGAGELWIDIGEDARGISLHITNDGAPPAGEVTPKGGLHNLYRCVLDCGGAMDIQSKPSFALTVTLPKTKEGTR